jgi:hypothetical protein
MIPQLSEGRIERISAKSCLRCEWYKYQTNYLQRSIEIVHVSFNSTVGCVYHECIVSLTWI